MDIPASLQHRIELFRETGRVFRVPNELFAENSWIQVMLGQGIMPQQHHPVADLMGDAELSDSSSDIKASVDKTVMQLPTAPGLRRTVLQGAETSALPRARAPDGELCEVAALAGVSLATHHGAMRLALTILSLIFPFSVADQQSQETLLGVGCPV